MTSYLSSIANAAASYLGYGNETSEAALHGATQGPSITDRLTAYLSSLNDTSSLKDLQRLVANYGHLTKEELEQHKDKLEPVLKNAAAHVKEAVDQHQDDQGALLDSVKTTLGPYLSNAAAAVHNLDLSSYATSATSTLSNYASKAKDYAEDLLDDGELNNSNKDGGVSAAKRALHELAVKVKEGDLPEETHGKLSDYVRSLGENVPTLDSLEALASKYGHLTADELSGYKNQLAPVLSSVASHLTDAAHLGPEALHKARTALGPYVSLAASKLHGLDLSSVISKADNVEKSLEGVGSQTADKILAYVAGVSGKVPTIGDLKNLAGKYGHLTAEEVATYTDELKPYLSGVGQKLQDAAALGPDALHEVLAHAGPYASAIAAKAKGVDLSSSLQRLKDVARDLADDGKLNNSIADMPDRVEASVKAVEQDGLSQLKDLAGDAKDKIQAYARSFTTIPSLEGLRNLSARFGQLTGDEIENAKDQLAPFLSSVASHVKNVLAGGEGMMEKGQDDVKQVASGALRRLQDLRAAVGPYVVDAVDQLHNVDIRGTLSQGLDRLSRAIPDFDVTDKVTGYLNGLKSIANNASSTASDATGDIKDAVLDRLNNLKALAGKYGQVGPVELSKFKDQLSPYLDHAGDRLKEAVAAGPEYVEKAREALGPYVTSVVAKAKGIDLPDASEISSTIVEKANAAKQTLGDLLDDGQLNGSNLETKKVLETIDEQVKSGQVNGPSVSERLSGYLSLVGEKLGNVKEALGDKLEGVQDSIARTATPEGSVAAVGSILAPLKSVANKYGHLSADEIAVFENKLGPVLSQAATHITKAVETAKKVGANPRLAGAKAIREIRETLGPAVARSATEKVKLPQVEVDSILSTVADLLDDGKLNQSSGNVVPNGHSKHHKK